MAEEVKKVAPKKTTSKAAPASAKAETVKKAAAPKAKAPVAEEKAPVAEVKEKVAAPKKEAVKKAPKAAPVAKETNRLKEKYQSVIVPHLIEKYGYKSIMAVPRLEKIVINIGVGDATQDAKRLEDSVRELTEITSQKPVVTKAKLSVASFKLREGQSIGCKVTLRGARMYDFLDKLVTIALPRVRDFRGVSKNAFDGRGNYTLGVKEQLIFPEINYDKINKIRGMDVVIVTTAHTDAEAFTLLQELGMPFQR